MSRFEAVDLQQWADDYKAQNSTLFSADPEFRRWFDEEYVPLGGAWQY